MASTLMNSAELPQVEEGEQGELAQIIGEKAAPGNGEKRGPQKADTLFKVQSRVGEKGRERFAGHTE